MRIASLIAKRDGLAKGREYLQGIEPRTQEDRIQIIQIEAQLLRDAKAWQGTFEVLSKAVEQYPSSFELLYDRAMAAERVDRLDVLEADLRRVIELKPDYAHAYNAWRGVKDMASKMTNSIMRGSFLKNPDLRREFLSLLTDKK